MLSILATANRTSPSRWGSITCLTLLLALTLMSTSPVFGSEAAADHPRRPPLQHAGAGVSGTVDLFIQPASTTVEVGQEFAVDIVVQAGQQPVDAVDAFVDFDPALVQVLEIMPGTALPTFLQSSFDNTTGQINYSAGRPLVNGPASGTFTLATIRLRALAPTPGTQLTFVFEPPSRKTDVFFQGLSVFRSATDATVVIQQPTPTATVVPPTATPTAAPRPVGGYGEPASPGDLLAPWGLLLALLVLAVFRAVRFWRCST
jgi:hypothetical protein